MAEDYCQYVRDKFFTFVQGFDNRNALGNYDHLEDYLAEWINLGDAIEVCGGDFGVFMAGVALIIAWYAEDPSSLDYRCEGEICHRRLDGLINLDGMNGSIWDRNDWQSKVLRRLLGQPLDR